MSIHFRVKLITQHKDFASSKSKKKGPRGHLVLPEPVRQKFPEEDDVWLDEAAALDALGVLVGQDGGLDGVDVGAMQTPEE